MKPAGDFVEEQRFVIRVLQSQKRCADHGATAAFPQFAALSEDETDLERERSVAVDDRAARAGDEIDLVDGDVARLDVELAFRIRRSDRLGQQRNLAVGTLRGKRERTCAPALVERHIDVAEGDRAVGRAIVDDQPSAMHPDVAQSGERRFRAGREVEEGAQRAGGVAQHDRATRLFTGRQHVRARERRRRRKHDRFLVRSAGEIASAPLGMTSKRTVRS